MPTFKVESDPHWLEMASWASQIILVIAALATLWYGLRQVQTAVAARLQDQETAHASAILEMDGRWESAEMKDARDCFMAVRQEVLQAVGTGNPQMNDAARTQLMRQVWATKLSQLRLANDPKYSQIMRICSFFETVGLLVKKGYVRRDDVVALFKGPILAIDTSFGGHIEDQLRETGMPAGLYEHALFLCQDCGSAT